MPDGLYEQDILVWSERQADLLRRLAAGKWLNEAVDWVNLIDEVEDVGRSELNSVESLLRQAMLHLLKLHRWPDSRDDLHWRVEVSEFLIQARKRFTPSMRQRLDLQDTYSDAVRQFLLQAGHGAQVPEACPFALDDLLAIDTDFARLLSGITDQSHA